MNELANNNWENFYVKLKVKNLIFPSETLIRCFKGDYRNGTSRCYLTLYRPKILALVI